MKAVILISGNIDSGKSSTIRMIYQQLFLLQNQHQFNGNPETTLQIQDFAAGEDFYAVFPAIKGKRIGLISGSDWLEEFQDIFNKVKKDIDILICASRSKNSPNSVYRFIVEELPRNSFGIKLNFSTFPTVSNEERTEMQQNIAETVINTL